MLHRNKAPNRGLWNGVGGRIEHGELPAASCQREIREETGYSVDNLVYKGVLTWDGFETRDGGLYIFWAQVEEVDRFPCEMEEGVLDWKPIDWVFSSDEVVSNIHRFGPEIVHSTNPSHFHFSYQNGAIIRYHKLPLPPWATL